MQRAEGTGAGCIHHAVGAPQVKLFADPSGNHVAEQAGEGVFLPRNIRIGDALDNVFGGSVIHTCVFESRAPMRVPETRGQRDNQFKCAGHTKNDADPVAIVAPVGTVAGILQRLSGGNQPKKLRAVNRFQSSGWNVVLHRVEGDFGEKSAPTAISHVGRFGILTMVVSHAPVGRRNIAYGVDPFTNIGPVGAAVFCTGEKAADSNDCQRFGAGCGALGIVLCHARYSLIWISSSGSMRKSTGSLIS